MEPPPQEPQPPPQQEPPPPPPPGESFHLCRDCEAFIADSSDLLLNDKSLELLTFRHVFNSTISASDEDIVSVRCSQCNQILGCKIVRPPSPNTILYLSSLVFSCGHGRALDPVTGNIIRLQRMPQLPPQLSQPPPPI